MGENWSARGKPTEGGKGEGLVSCREVMGNLLLPGGFQEPSAGPDLSFHSPLSEVIQFIFIFIYVFIFRMCVSLVDRVVGTTPTGSQRNMCRAFSAESRIFTWHPRSLDSKVFVAALL